MLRAIFRSPRRVAAVATVAVTLVGIVYWGYAVHQQRLWQSTALELVRDATRRAQLALQTHATDAESLQRLETEYGLAAAAAQQLESLQRWRDPPLAEAAQRYLGEVQALLRRRLMLGSGENALRAEIEGLSVHLRGAHRRSSGWISGAIAKKRDMERRFFDYRLAVGGLQKSLDALPVARGQLAPLVGAELLLDARLVATARNRVAQASAGLQREVEVARTLPEPR